MELKQHYYRLWIKVGTPFAENERYRHSQISAWVHTGWLKKCGSTMGKMERQAIMKTEDTRKCS